MPDSNPPLPRPSLVAWFVKVGFLALGLGLLLFADGLLRFPVVIAGFDLRQIAGFCCFPETQWMIFLSLGVYFIKINSGGFSKIKMIVKE